MLLELKIPFTRARRASYFSLVGLTILGGTTLMATIVSAQGLTLLECLILALFVPTFACIVVPFWTALVGFGLRLFGHDPITLAPVESLLQPDPDVEGPHRSIPSTALVIPIHNEQPELVMARVEAMVRSIRRVRLGCDDVHVHILSDTRENTIAREEVTRWMELQSRYPEFPIHYRRRDRNEGRKAGNVAEFCERCSDDYDLMVVLDADSLMTGEIILHLAHLMQVNPDVGLIQTLPLPALQRSLFGRLLQFAGALYGPVLASGQAFWYGDAANYWGHNAIIRLRPFRDHAKLPVLSGRPPMGGEILSHDFVEAAFLRRAGWRVVFVPSAAGSWEEVPANLDDYARRDRRWAQGSLQHLRLLNMSGLHPLSRLHFLLGAMAYISSLLWMAILVAGTAYVLMPLSHGATLATRSLVEIPELSLLAVTASLLLLPKSFGLIVGLTRDRDAFGGPARLVISVLVETVFSVLLAPVMMLSHARSIFDISRGRAVGWSAQDRERADLTWREGLEVAFWPTVVGLIWGSATLALSPLFFAWMSPIFLGLICSVPLVRWTSLRSLGARARVAGLLLVPSETAPSDEIVFVSVTQNRLSLGPDPEEPDPLNDLSVPPPFPPTANRIMYNAERGLFDLRQGRALLITDRDASRSGSKPVMGALVAAVDGLDPVSLDRLRSMGTEPLRLVVTAHRVGAMGLSPEEANAVPSGSYSIVLRHNVELHEVLELACSRNADRQAAARRISSAAPAEAAALSLIRLSLLLPAVISIPVWLPPTARLDRALGSGEVLSVEAKEVNEYVESCGVEVVAISEAPVPLAESSDSRFVLFREPHGFHEHVAVIVGDREHWPDPVPVRLHSACLTGDVFGSLRCDCGEQLRGSMDLFRDSGGGVLVYLAQEGRGIGLGNKFRAYTLQEGGLDTIEADRILGFGPDERSYGVAASILDYVGVKRVELLTNNPEKVRAMQDAGIEVVNRRPLHGTLNRHNRPYVEAKVNRAGHWLHDMLAQPIRGD